MKKLIQAIALLTLNAPVFADSATSGGGRYIADFDIKTDEIKVSSYDSVADECLLNPQALKNTAEAELRRLGFKIAGGGQCYASFTSNNGIGVFVKKPWWAKWL